MTSEELKKLIKTGENGVVEFKRGCGGVPGDFWSSYSAFANTDGGVIKTNTKKTCSKSEKTRGKSLETRGKKAECLL